MTGELAVAANGAQCHIEQQQQQQLGSYKLTSAITVCRLQFQSSSVMLVSSDNRRALPFVLR